MKINRNNYEDFLIQKLEGMLNTEQNAELDLFLHNNADIRSEWEAFELTRLIPDESLMYEHKDLLKKKQTTGVIPMYRTILYVTSIAASLLFVFFISQKYLINQPDEKPVVAENNSARNNSTENSVPLIKPSNNNAIVADNFPSNNNQPAFSKQNSTKNFQIVNVNQPGTSNLKPETNAPISFMKTLSPVAMKTYPRISYASFIWTKGLKSPAVPSRNVSEASTWLQVASILGSEIIRLSGRTEKINKAPIELKILQSPVHLKINNSYLRFNKILSFKKKNKNNK